MVLVQTSNVQMPRIVKPTSGSLPQITTNLILPAPRALKEIGLELNAMFGVLRPGSPEEEQMPISPADSPPPANSMAPMPPSQFNSREELLEHAKNWAARQGYAIVIARSRFNRLWLKCDRGGVYENRRNLTPEQRKRKRSDSRLLGCPFRMLAVVRKDGVWRVSTENAEHNHDPSEDLSVHPTLRRLTEVQSQKVNEMTEAGNSPAETLEELRKIWPDIKVLTRDIYNARKKYKAQKEMAEAASSVPDDQQFGDPNGFIPGPTPNGRWEWVPDENDASNKSKRRRRRPPIEQQSLDPQLQNPNVPQALDPGSDSAGYPTNPTFQQPLVLASLPQNNVQLLRHDSAPTRLQRTPTFNRQSSSFEFVPQPTNEENPMSPSPVQAGLSQHRASLQLHHSDPGTMQPLTGHMGGFPAQALGYGGAQIAAAAATQQAAPRVQNAQMLISRIERMEKEQQDQRNMLSQILGAVQMMQGPPTR
jgi:hypothetical protein